MLSLNYDPKRKAVWMVCDAKGLLASLSYLIGERASHIHLRSPQSGGKDLDCVEAETGIAVTELVIDYAEGDR